jgi:hypothetical protein
MFGLEGEVLGACTRKHPLVASIGGAEDCGRSFPMRAAKSKANPSWHASTHFIQTFYSEPVFILDFDVLFHVIR